MVQIHSPRPFILQSAIYRHTNGRLSAWWGQVDGSNPFGPTILSLLYECVTLRSHLRCPF